MRLTPSEPDVRTLVGRIKEGEINLQPDFQRGEVWPTKKKQRLVDTILREWHVPPVHLIELPNRKQEVLDGQQRLIAIRDFTEDVFPVDGSIEPFSEVVAALDGRLYSQLPGEIRRQFNQYAVRVIGVTDYIPAEVGELFLRLNQPANLTTAEQRNAFFGPARSQIKSLVSRFSGPLFFPDAVGFSNSRMAYDDVVARFCVTIEANDLWRKIGASDITTKYRSNEGFNPGILTRAEKAIGLFSDVMALDHERIRFNKATLFSWILFYDGLLQMQKTHGLSELNRHLNEFEISRNQVRAHSNLTLVVDLWNKPDARFLLGIFNDRASARVADVMSVVLRDFVLWFTLLRSLGTSFDSAKPMNETAQALWQVRDYLRSNNEHFSESMIEQALLNYRWRPLS